MIYLTLLLTFMKIGAFTFGGGYAMIPLIQEEVLAHGWMTLEELINFIAVSESTPGVFAVNISTYIGMETAGFFGAFCSTLGVVLPSFLIILIVAHCYEKFKESRLVKGCMSGLKPAVVGLIATAVLSTALQVFFPAGVSLEAVTTGSFLVSAAIFGVMLHLALKKKSPILIIVISAVCGIIAGYCGLF